MSTQVAPLGLRLFLEGVEVPVISAQVNIQKGSAATAVIQIVPTDSSLLLLPRTLVHLFYLDNEFIDGTNPDKLTSTARDGRGQPLHLQDDQNRFTVADEQYKLFFAGEVIGINYQKTSTGRAMVLQCLDFSSYWDTCYQWYAEFAVGGDGLTDVSHNFVGAGQYLFNDVAAGTQWVISNILNSKPEDPLYRDTEGLLAGYIHLLETIGGIRPGKKGNYKAFRGVNDFFSIAELMYKLTGMLGAVQSDKTSQRIFANKAFSNWLRNGMASAGSLVSFRDTLRIVGQYIFHECYPNPAAFYQPAGTTTALSRPQTTVKTVLGKDVVNTANTIKAGLRTVVNKMLQSGNPKEVLRDESFAVLVSASVTLRGLREIISDAGGTDAAKLNLKVGIALAEVDGAKLVFDLDTGIALNADGTGYLINQTAATLIEKKLVRAINQLNEVMAGASITSTVRVKQEIEVGEHLFNQLLLPETFFCAPPRCNVLFPDMYSSFSYSRNFLRETSRLSCAGGLGMIANGSGTKMLGRNYFAPNIKVQDKIVRETVYSTGTTLMPHEVHSGIIPKFEWVTDGHRWGVDAAKGQGKLTKGKKISYIQRLANFQFFTHRWMARQMSVQARFNPHMVIGFPGVIIDRTRPNVGVLFSVGGRTDATQALLPTAYVGKVATLQHSVSQNGGSTSVVYSHARTHKGLDDEFLGLVKREGAGSRIQTVQVPVQEVVDDLGAGLRSDDLQVQIVQLWIKQRLAPGISLLAGEVTRYDTTGQIEVTRSQLRLFGVTDDDVDSLKNLQGAANNVPDNTENAYLPQNIQVQVEFRPIEGQAVPVTAGGAFEDITRPGWYAPDVWNNENITAQVYGPLLGTSAITDEVQLEDQDNFVALVKNAILTAVPDGVAVTVDEEGDNLVIKVNGVAASTFTPNAAQSIETAIDSMTLLYGILKTKGGQDVQRFIDDYVKRPVANMVQILGDSDFQLDGTGNVRARADGTVPYEGFHSRAFGPYNTNVQFRVQTGDGASTPRAGENALLGLLPTDAAARKAYEESGTIIDREKKRIETKIPPHLDPRGRAQERVRMYVDELKFTRGILGA